MGPVQGWHRGERAIQQKMGHASAVTQSWTWIEPEMPEPHQVFYTTRLPFIPVTTIDDRQRPWACILAGPDGKPGFATSQNFGELTVHAKLWEGDPFAKNVASSKGQPILIAGIGVEYSTRRRSKFAGHIESIESDGSLFHIRTVVNEAIENCPKYINIRDTVPFSDTHPRVVYHRLNLSSDERLPDDIISLIHESDAIFLGTYYQAEDEDREKFPSHVGMNQRAGKAGFVRVRPSDGRTMVIPDYSGNRLLSSLGNIEATPLAGVTIISFVTGAILYLTGDAHNLVGPAAQRLMPQTNALTTIHITGYILVEDALPIRQKSGTMVHRSPYSPPVRLLAEETTSTYFIDNPSDQPKVTLARIEMHSHDLATFTFESLTHIDITPGQAAILDFKSFVGALPYQYLAPENPMTVNDDRVRTWTISGSSHWSTAPQSKESGPILFTITMRHKPGGTVTTALFSIAQKLGEFRPELLKDTRPLQLSLPLVGVVGDFTFPTTSMPHRRKLLWLAGGIGLTPFLAMLAGLNETLGLEEEDAGVDHYDIMLVFSTREPQVLIPLVNRALKCDTDRTRGALSIHIFSSEVLSASANAETRMVLAVDVTQHGGRLNTEAFRNLGIGDLDGRDVYVCGPAEFEKAAIGALKEIGLESQKIWRESFAY